MLQRFPSAELREEKKMIKAMKSTSNTLIASVAAFAIFAPASIALAEFPEKPITMLIGFRPGGAVDTTGRLVAANLEKILGQPVVAVQKAGGGGAVMASTLINAKPDGYTIGMGASAAYTLAPQLNKKIKYRIDDFDHLGTLSIPQDALVVRKDSPWNSLQDMVNDAKKNNKTLSIASQVAVVNLLAQAITKKDGVKFKIVPVKGGSRGILQVLGGHVDLTWSGSGWHKQVAAGTMKPLVTISAKRMPDYPSLPTMLELGYGYTFTDTFMLSAPKGLPTAVKAKLGDAIKNAITPDLSKRLLSKMKLATDHRGPAATTAFLHKQYNDVKPMIAVMRQGK